MSVALKITLEDGDIGLFKDIVNYEWFRRYLTIDEIEKVKKGEDFYNNEIIIKHIDNVKYITTTPFGVVDFFESFSELKRYIILRFKQFKDKISSDSFRYDLDSYGINGLKDNDNSFRITCVPKEK